MPIKVLFLLMICVILIIFGLLVPLPTILLTPAEAELEPKFRLRSSYVSAIHKSGGLPMVGFPRSENPGCVDALLERVDGLLLTGGRDVHPLFFGEQPKPGLGYVFPERDEFEIALARRALELGLPVLGICCGIQVLNVAAGGTLHQDISSLPHPSPVLHSQKSARSTEWHSVAFEPGSQLAGVFKDLLTNHSLNVNSLHHQAIAIVANGWVVSAVAPDGIIEAVECPSQPFAVGVQWHPESLERQAPLFTAFVAAAENYRAQNLRTELEFA